MTAANVTDLDDKDTGDPAGDLVFNMDERAIPLVCRHSKTASTDPNCVAGNTHSWLLDTTPVYLQWVIEVDGVWGPYQMCNLNLTDRATGKLGDGKWFCDGARFDRTNFTDSKLCSTCAATKSAVGLAAMNGSSLPSHVLHVSGAACNATFKRVCKGALGNYSACQACGAHNFKPLLENISDCNWSELCAPPVSAAKPSMSAGAFDEQLVEFKIAHRMPTCSPPRPRLARPRPSSAAGRCASQTCGTIAAAVSTNTAMHWSKALARMGSARPSCLMLGVVPSGAPPRPEAAGGATHPRMLRGSGRSTCTRTTGW